MKFPVMTKACAELVGRLCRLHWIWVSFLQKKNSIASFVFAWNGWNPVVVLQRMGPLGRIAISGNLKLVVQVLLFL